MCGEGETETDRETDITEARERQTDLTETRLSGRRKPSKRGEKDVLEGECGHACDWLE